MKKYREEHKEQLALYDKLYSEKNKEQLLANDKIYYLNNRETILLKHKKRQSLLYNLKRERGCYHCGEDDPTMLTFHHLDPTIKKYVIKASMITKEDFWEEIDKCIVLCHNCHHTPSRGTR